jgi:subtilisin family serine protease
MDVIIRSLIVSIVLTACGGRDDASTSGHGTQPATDGGLCPGARIIGVLDQLPEPDGSACLLDGAVPEGWRASVLFERGSPGVAALEQPAPGALQRYCSYEWSGTGAAELEPMLAAIDAHADMHAVAPDCGLGAGQAEPDEQVDAALRAAFLLNIGALSGEALGPSDVLRTPIEVAVIDSISQQAADDPQVVPADPHGQNIAALIAEIVCPARRPECLAQLHHTLALPRVDGNMAPDWVRGGRRGTPADVALGIYEAVETWHRGSEASPRLVINLSIGWEPSKSPRGPDLALQAALEYAACHGALVFAAAGNDVLSSCGEHRGPLTPASFESLPAPTADQCQAFGFTSRKRPEYPIFAENPRPLVYAVGGVDERGRALTNARVGGRPRLAATAANALALGPDGEYTMTLSGSSVAAAVASGAAALIWSYRPNLRPDELVELLHQTGWNSEDRAEFGLSGPPAQIHRLSICAALERTCAADPTKPCPTLTCPPVAPAADGNRAGVHAALAERRANARPGTVHVHHAASRVIESSCDDRDAGLAAPQ